MSVVKLITLAQGTVTTSGTEVRASSADLSNVVKLFITCPESNTGNIFVGDASVATTRGVEVIKGTTLEIEAPNGNFIDVYNIWVDAATNGDKYNVSYLKRV